MPAMEGKISGHVIWAGVAFFFLALALRVLFFTATPDAQGAYSPYYEGDTAVWLDYARAIESGAEYDLGLPLRPPGSVRSSPRRE